MWIAIVIALALWSGPAWAGLNEPVGCAQLPALTGDVTTTAGSCATSGRIKWISTQTVAAGASIAFTGLATYNTYEFFCSGVFPSTVVGVFLQIGEGATPTWQNSSYRYFNFKGDSSGSTVGGINSASASSITIEAGVDITVAKSISFRGTIWNVTSTSAYKEILIDSSLFDGSYYHRRIGGAYTGGTNAVTGIRIIPASANITGTCSLWALVE